MLQNRTQSSSDPSRASLFALCAAALILASASGLFAQSTLHDPLPRRKWTAQWISHPTAPLREPLVLHFRKAMSLASHPEHFPVHVSADNRFVLFVNGKRVGEGPARGELSRWRYETFDLAPFLHEGENVIAANVWQFGVFAPLAQTSDRIAFLMEGETAAEARVNTDRSWQVEQETGHAARRPMPEGVWEYWAAGPGERIDGGSYDWEWKGAGVSTRSRWVNAAPAIRESIYPGGSTAGSRMEDTGLRWLLVPDPLPHMEFTQVPTGTVVRTTFAPARNFPEGPVTIPANTEATILIDHGSILTAYPELILSGGKGAAIEAMYTEALYDSKHQRSNRNEIDNRTVQGLTDEFLADGGAQRSFMPLWWRTWRYLQLRVKTSEEPLRLESLRTFYTAYPFEERGKFSSSDPELKKIRDICWRTARLDAHETYMDSAYWEQLQYIGDTRLQALISYVIGGDDRLARQALRAFDESRVPDGITQSRAPSSLAQFIPPFSLLHINMLHDYWMYQTDKAFVAELLPGTRAVLQWFLARQRPDGLLSALPGWTFIDSPTGVDNFPRADSQGRSAVVTLQFIGALLDAAALEEALGNPAIAADYRAHAQLAAQGVYKSCWDDKHGLLADTPEKNSYSQHTNLLAVLFDVVPLKGQRSVMERVLAADSINGGQSTKLAKVSLFFQFYLARAIEHAGMGERYLELLKPWNEMLAKGLTTTPEYPDPSRSDTHAWSAHPAYDLTTLVAGIRPDAPGFAKVRIQPNLGNLEQLSASLPSPAGMIEVSYKTSQGKTNAIITLPSSLNGTFVWKGEEHLLHGGRQQFQLP